MEGLSLMQIYDLTIFKNIFYVTHDRLNNASFRQKLDAISKNIFITQDLLELVFQDTSIFDAQNPVIRSLLKKLDISKKDATSDLVEKTTRPWADDTLQKRFDALKLTNLILIKPTAMTYHHRHHYHHLITLSHHCHCHDQQSRCLITLFHHHHHHHHHHLITLFHHHYHHHHQLILIHCYDHHLMFHHHNNSMEQ